MFQRSNDKTWDHRVLPPDAQAELKRAALTPVTDADPLARSRAIDQAVRKIKSRYPDLFWRYFDEN